MAHARKDWDVGAPLWVTKAGKEYVFDRENGPFGIITPGGGRPRICVKRLPDGETVSVASVRGEARTLSERMSLVELKRQKVPGTTAAQKRARWEIDYCATRGIAPVMPTDMIRLAGQKHLWTARATFEQELGMLFTAEGYPAKLDGSPYRPMTSAEMKAEVAAERLGRKNVVKELSFSAARQHGGLTQDQIRHVEWISVPVKRDESDWEVWARELGYTVTTLRLWTRLPEFQARMAALAIDELNNDYNTVMAIRALLNEVHDGDAQSAKTYLDLKQKLAPKVFSNADGEDNISPASKLSREELEKRFLSSGLDLVDVVSGKSAAKQG